jgi:alanine racemase
MNTENDAFGDTVKFDLEPSLFSMHQLEEFIAFLKQKKITNYPIHLTFETGMNRLGFYQKDIPDLIKVIQNSPEVQLKSVYSHLADADNTDLDYTKNQIEQFREIRTQFKEAFTHDILFHILNSEGTSKFGDTAAFDMVRLGIGVFGYTSTAKQDRLMPFMKWFTTISQIKAIQPGETIGYGRTYTAEKPMKIAILRIGYADGFRRSLSNGVGAVFIDGKACPVVGNVCMDMTMVDVTDVACQEGDQVEIIGDNNDMFSFSKRLKTISYEVMTSINKRVSRVYLK